MGLAPHPADAGGNRERRGSIRTTVVDASPPQTMLLRQTVDGLLWETNTELLNRCELFAAAATRDEYAWKTLRKALLDLLSNEQRVIRMAINQIMALPTELSLESVDAGQE